MVNELKLWNFAAGHDARVDDSVPCFQLQTCQRTLVAGFTERPFGPEPLPLHERVEGREAYLFLLETICGLKSKLLGENEIVAQFKAAYQEYARHPAREGEMLLVLEKLFKDAKEIRTAHLVGLGLKTYASLTRRHFMRAKAPEVLILGSGQLAEDLVNQFKKRSRVLLSARNHTHASELARLHGVEVVAWDDRARWMRQAFIANTIGFEGVLLDEDFFASWETLNPHRLLVDLGSPSCLRTQLGRNEGVLRLADILAEGAVVEDQKQARLQLARTAMLELVERRARWLEERSRKWQASPQVSFLEAQPV